MEFPPAWKHWRKLPHSRVFRVLCASTSFPVSWVGNLRSSRGDFNSLLLPFLVCSLALFFFFCFHGKTRYLKIPNPCGKIGWKINWDFFSLLSLLWLEFVCIFLSSRQLPTWCYWARKHLGALVIVRGEEKGENSAAFTSELTRSEFFSSSKFSNSCVCIHVTFEGELTSWMEDWRWNLSMKNLSLFYKLEEKVEKFQKIFLPLLLLVLDMLQTFLFPIFLPFFLEGAKSLKEKVHRRKGFFFLPLNND